MASFSKDIDVENIYKDLGKSEGKKEKLFETMKDVYMLAFLLGFKNNQKIKLNKKSQDSIKEETFGPENKIIMDFIALYLKKDINILKKDDKSEDFIHEIVEEYANGGIRIISELLGKDYNNLDNLINVIKEFEEKSEEPKKLI